MFFFTHNILFNVTNYTNMLSWQNDNSNLLSAYF